MFYFNLIKDTLTTLAIGSGAIVAIIGLKTWKKQLRGHTEYDLARRVMIAVYKVRDTIGQVRDPSIPLEESKKAVEELSAKTTNEAMAVYQIRWRRLSDEMTTLGIETLEAEVVWGQEIKEVQKPLLKCIRTLHFNIAQYVNPAFYGKADKTDYDIIYEGNADEPNYFTKEINKEITKIELFLKPYLKLAD